MANVNAPFGLWPLRKKDGTACVASNEYSIASAYNTNIFRGDPVEMTGTDTNIQLAAAGNTDNYGVFWGVSYVDSEGKQQFKKYWPANTVATNIRAVVYDDPNIIFRMQSDATGIAAADIGTLVDWEAGTGSTTYGRSGAMLDLSAGTGTSGKSLRIRRLFLAPDNALGANAVAEVEFAEHALIPGGGVGV